MANDWQDWTDAAVTPHAATPISTAMSAFTILADPPPTIAYDKEASFLQHMFTDAGIVLPAEVDLLALTTTYRGQFPALLMKLRISYDMAFPAHWKEAFLMQSFSDWWFPSLPAATGRAPAPVVSPTPMNPAATSLRMCALQHLLPLTNGPLLVLGDFGDIDTFVPLLPAVQADHSALNVVPSCMSFDGFT